MEHSTATNWRPLALLIFSLACGQDARNNQITLEQCRIEIERKEYARAKSTCTTSFEVSANRESGMLAAQASYLLGEYDELAQWIPRLEPHEEAGRVLAMMGTVERDSGNVERALQQWTRGQRYLVQGGELARASTIGTWIGNEYWKQARFTPALEAFERAAALGERAKDPATRFTAYGFMADCLYEAGATLGAEHWHDKAAHLAATTPRCEVDHTLRMGILAWALGRTATAKVAYEQALEGFEALGDRSNVRIVHLNLAELYAENEDLERATSHAEAAAKIHRELAPEGPSPHRDASTRYYSSLVSLANDDPRGAIELLGTPSENDPTDWQWQLDTQRAKAYRRLGDMTMAEQALNRAVIVVEGLRGQEGPVALRERVAWARREPYIQLLDLHAVQSQTDKAIEVYRRATASILIDSVIGPRSPIDSSEDYALWAGQRASLEQQTKRIEPSTRHDFLSPVIVWVSGHSTTHALIFIDDSWSIQKIDIGRNELRQIIATLDIQLETQPTIKLPEPLSKIFTLIPPRTPLLVVAEGSLATIPFAAVLVEGRPLGARNLVRRHLSIARVHDPNLSMTSGGRRLAYVDPNSDLLEAKAEGRALAENHNFELASGPAATLAAVREAASSSILHLGTHVGTDRSGTFVQLADGRLYSSEIASWPYAPRTVVLASCSSGRETGAAPGDSLPGAFLAAGARQVLATRWAVNDEDARRFVSSFYHHGGDIHPVAALTMTQAELRRMGWSAKRWAAYVVFGEPDDSF